MDISKYRDIFFTEAREHLTQLNSVLVRFEGDQDFGAAVDELFRSVHTIKGMASAMGFEPIADFAHELENLFDAFRESAPVEDDTELLFGSFDALDALVDAAEKEEDLVLPAELSRQVNARTKTIQLGDTAVVLGEDGGTAGQRDAVGVVPVDDGIPAFRVVLALEPACAFKIARAMVVVGTLDSIGRVLKCDPEVAEADESTFDGRLTVFMQCVEGEEFIRERVSSVPEIASLEVLPFVEEAQEAQEVEAPQAAPARKERLDRSFIAKETVRLNVRHLENLMAATETLVMDRAALSRLAEERRDKDLEQLVSALSRDLSDLQHEVLQARMVPASEIFDRFPRMVRDVGKELGKEVDLVCEGRSTEFDRSLLEHLGDPLVHLLRNAIDHGVELPDERETCGKSRRGTVIVRATRDRNNVVFTVEDDGRGINADAVFRKAVANGLVTENEAKTMGFDDALELIMQPGFSTASQVSEVSGRGVGLDVVRNSIRSLGGALNIANLPDGGSRCTMSMPITLAIIRALLVEVSGEEYAIPVGRVGGVLAVTPKEMRMVNNQLVCVQEDDVLPLVRMQEALGAQEDATQNGKPKTVVIVSVGTRKVGLVFDRLVEQQDIVVKGLGQVLSRTEGFSGVTIGGDGRPILIIDVASFI